MRRAESNLIAFLQYCCFVPSNLNTVDLQILPSNGGHYATLPTRTQVPLLEVSRTVTAEFLSSLPSQVILQCLLPTPRRVNIQYRKR